MISHREVLHYLDWCRQAAPTRATGARCTRRWPSTSPSPGCSCRCCAERRDAGPEDEHPIAGLADVLSSGRKFSFVKLTPAHLEPLRRCLAPKAASRHAPGRRW